MEIKRRLGALAKRMTPAIEAMNVANEMLQILQRFEELASYAEQKITRSEERIAAKLAPIGAQQDAKKKADAKEIADLHEAEQNELLQDQVQHSAQEESFTEADTTPDPLPEDKALELNTSPPAQLKKTGKKKGKGAYFEEEPD